MRSGGVDECASALRDDIPCDYELDRDALKLIRELPANLGITRVDAQGAIADPEAFYATDMAELAPRCGLHLAQVGVPWIMAGLIGHELPPYTLLNPNIPARLLGQSRERRQDDRILFSQLARGRGERSILAA
jgi:hypothetical protein